MVSTWTVNSPRWTREDEKMSISLSKRGSVTVGRDTEKERSEGMLSEMVCQKEIRELKFHL